MRAPRALRLGLGLAGLALLACNRVEWRAASQGPNLLLVTIDTLRADHVGAYGAAFARTPTLDGLAREGVRFETAMSPVPLTLPSHASLFTGRYPPHHGVRHNGLFRLPASAETLAERLRAAGYATGAVVGAMVLSENYGLAQGFEHYDDEDLWGRRAGAGGYLERDARAVTDRALAWLEGLRDPFFLWVHYFDPHAAYRPPPPFDREFRGRPYDGEIAYVDAELGRLLAALREDGRLGRTLVVATADHGESLGEHGESTHSFTLHDGVLRVPLLMRGAGMPRGRVVESLVRSVDVAPTVLAWLGLPPLPETDGRSLVPLLRGEDDPGPVLAYAETLATRYEHGWAPLFAARASDALYVHAPRPELYDLTRDPRERHNLLEGDDAAARERARELDAAIAPLVAVEPSAPSEAPDAETRDQLAALGYVVEPGFAGGRSRIDPKDGLAALPDYNAAQGAFDAENLAQAERLLRRVLERVPGSPRATSLLARVHLVRGEYREAAARLAEAVEAVPSSALYHSLLGDARAGLGDLEGALEAYERAVALDDACAPAHAGLMLRAVGGGSVEEAAVHAARASELEPWNLELHVHIATVWARLGEPGRALAAALQALRTHPDSARAHMEAALALVTLGREAEGRPHLDRAGRLVDDPLLSTRLAIALAAAGELDRAETRLRELVARHPGAEAPRSGLAHLLRHTGRAAEALAFESTPPAAQRR